MNGHGKKLNLTTGDYKYYELSNEITPGLTPNDPKHCLTPITGYSYDEDLLIRISKFYTGNTIIEPEEPDEPTIEIDPVYGWINPLTFTAEDPNSKVALNYTKGEIYYISGTSDQTLDEIISKKNNNWSSYTSNTSINLTNVGDWVKFANSLSGFTR